MGILLNEELMQGIKLGKETNVKMLIEAGADVNSPDKSGEAPLLAACITAKPEIVKTLIKAGAKTDVKTSIGISPLSYATMIGNYEIYDLLTKAGAKIDNKDLKLKESFYFSMFFGSLKISEDLLKKGFDPNYFSEGMTPLMAAASDNQDKTVKLLLDYGTDKNLKAKDGKTAYDLAGNQEIKDMLTAKATQK